MPASPRNNTVGTIWRSPDNRHLDRLVYKYQPREKPLADCPVVFFHLDFIHKPVLDWEVDWTGAQCFTVQRRTTPCFPACMEGVLMKFTHLQRVWRLTGEIDTNPSYSCDPAYEGRWPD
jgi:hypothetical protein